MVQFGAAPYRRDHVSLLEPLLLLVLLVAIGAVMVPLLETVVIRSRGRLRSWRLERRRSRAAATAELRARALMSELCPHGWRAQITLFEIAGANSSHALDGIRDRVAVDWIELEDERGRPAVMRRVWAPTIGEALEAMVADRRTDETLEQIEQGAVADGALWPDL